MLGVEERATTEVYVKTDLAWERVMEKAPSGVVKNQISEMKAGLSESV